jgi:predicted transcriptional regulator
MTKSPRPTNAQLALLTVLWQLGSATVREVHEALPESTKRGYTTTLKQLQLMAESGLVERDESNRSHIYSALVSEEETNGHLIDDLLDKAFGGSAAELVMGALSKRKTSPKELDAIRKLLTDIENGEEGR